MNPEEWRRKVLEGLHFILEPHGYKEALWARIKFYPASGTMLTADDGLKLPLSHRQIITVDLYYSPNDKLLTVGDNAVYSIYESVNWWDSENTPGREFASLWNVEAGVTTLKTFCFRPEEVIP
jgi:hypothetical protein